mgnify:CR=1 FL=1
MTYNMNGSSSIGNVDDLKLVRLRMWEKLPVWWVLKIKVSNVGSSQWSLQIFGDNKSETIRLVLNSSPFIIKVKSLSYVSSGTLRIAEFLSWKVLVSILLNKIYLFQKVNGEISVFN